MPETFERLDDYVSRRALVAQRSISTPRVLIQLIDYSNDGPWDHVLSLPHHCLLNFRLANAGRAFGSCPQITGTDQPCEVGDVALLPPSPALRLRTSSHQVRSLSCVFNWNHLLLHERLPIPDRLDPRQFGMLLDLEDQRLRAILDRLLRVTGSDMFGASLEAESLALLALTVALRKVFGETGPSGGGLASWQVRRVEDRIAATEMPPATLAELALLCRISERHLTRAYRAARGISIGQLSRMHLVRRAHELLRTDLAITEVARRLGFRSVASFSTAFKRETGMTPSGARRSGVAVSMPFFLAGSRPQCASDSRARAAQHGAPSGITER